MAGVPSLQGPAGGAQGYNGVTQGNKGALLGGDVQPNPTSFVPPSGGVGSVVDAGTLMALQAILPFLNQNQTPQQGTSNAPTGSGVKPGTNKSSVPPSPGGSGVVAPQGQDQGMVSILKSLGLIQ